MIKILFTGESPNLEFVEIENTNGKSVSVGQWSQEGLYKVLTINSDDVKAVELLRGQKK